VPVSESGVSVSVPLCISKAARCAAPGAWRILDSARLNHEAHICLGGFIHAATGAAVSATLTHQRDGTVRVRVGEGGVCMAIGCLASG
jgi:hypothetical protein